MKKKVRITIHAVGDEVQFGIGRTQNVTQIEILGYLEIIRKEILNSIGNNKKVAREV